MLLYPIAERGCIRMRGLLDLTARQSAIFNGVDSEKARVLFYRAGHISFIGVRLHDQQSPPRMAGRSGHST